MISPILNGYTLDLDKNFVELTFSESVKATTLDATAITMQSRSGGGTARKLTGGVLDSTDGPIIKFNLTAADVNFINSQADLAVGATSSFLSFADSLIDDIVGNKVTPRAATSAIGAQTFRNDTTQPRLIGFSIKMNGSPVVPPLILSLTFDEYVQRTSLDILRLVLQPVQSNTNASTAHQLTKIATATTQPDPTILEVTIDPADLLAIRDLPKLGQTTSSSFVSIDAGAVRDAFSNPSQEIKNSSGVQANSVTADLIPPALSSFSLDLNTATLTLTMDEDVRPGSVKPNRITLQSLSTSSAVSQTLSASTAVVVSGTIVTLTLTGNDEDALKRVATLTTNDSNTFLSATRGFVHDVADNQAETISNSAAKSVTLFVLDSTRPTLTGWDVNLNTQRVTLSFDEIVTPSTLDITQLSVQELRGGGQRHQLTGGTVVTTANSKNVLFILSDSDTNSIKRLSAVAVSNVSAYLTASATTIEDVSGNFLNVILSTDARQVTTFVSDTDRPSVTSFTFDQDNGELSFVMSETVDVSTLNVGRITIQASGTSSVGSHTLTSGSALSHGDSDRMIITLSLADQNVLKRLSLCSDTTSCFVSFTDQTVKDMVGQAVVARPSTDALQASTVTKDATGPELTAFTSLDLIVSQITLSFSETVSVATLLPTEINLQSLFQNPPETYILTGGVIITTADSSSVTVNLTTTDLASIKNMANLCSRRGNCYFSAGSALVNDTAGNAFQAVPATFPGKIVGTLVDDTVQPNLVQFDMDMNGGFLVLSWNEPVRASSLDTSKITLVDGVPAVSRYTLTGGTTVSPNGLVINITLLDVDLLAIKATTIGKNASTSRLALAAGALTDMSFIARTSTAIPESNAQLPNTFTSDIEAPTITFYRLDMNADHLQITFIEPIRTTPFDFKRFSLKANCSVTTPFTLTGGSLVGSPNDGVSSVTIQLTSADTVALKKDAGFARSINNSFLQVSTNTVQDMSGVFMQAVQCLRPTTHTADAQQARITAFTLDMQTGVMNLTFSDVVKASTFAASGLTIQNAARGTVKISLSTSTTTSSPDGYVLTVQISDSDLFRIKSEPTLARSLASTFLTAQASVVDDVFDVDILAITDGKALQATTVVADNTAPALSSWELDLDAGTVTLTFSDTVNSTSFNQSAVVLQNAAASPSSTLRLGKGTFVQSGVGRVLTMTVSTAEINQLTASFGLRTAKSTSFIQVDNGVVLDLGGNAVPSTTQQVKTHTADTTAPLLSSFSLDMDSGRLAFTFDETVHASSLATTQITLQSASNSQSASERYRLKSTGTVSTANSTIITVDFATTDLDGIKANDALAKNQASTFLSFLNSTVEDMSGNSIVEVLSSRGQSVVDFTADTQSPRLVDFTLNLNTTPAVLTLSFNEAVKASSLVITDITLHASRSAGAESFKLSGGTASTTNGLVLTVSLSSSDLLAIQAHTLLATATGSTFVSAPNTTVTDMFNNALQAVPVTSAIGASSVVADARQPSLQSYSLDIDGSGELTLSFNEVIDLSSVVLSSISIQSDSSSSPSANYTLTSNSIITTATNAQIFTINLGTDLDTIKLNTTLAVSSGTTFVCLKAGAVKDMLGNSLGSLTPLRQPTTFVGDGTAPQVSSFTFDAAVGLLQITFDEPVDQSTLKVNRLTLQHNASADLPSTAQLTLLSPTTSGSPNGKTLDITLSVADLTRMQDRAQLGTTRTNTFLSFTADAVRDMAANPIASVSPTSAIQASSVSGDGSGPSVTGFMLDVNAGTVTLTFNETVDSSTFIATHLTFSNESSSSSTSETVTLSRTGSHTRPVETQIVLTLDSADLDSIKSLRNLGTTAADTFLTYSAGLVSDFVPNAAPARTSGLGAQNVTDDTDPPSMTSFSFDMNAGEMKLTFNELIDAVTLNLTHLLIQDGRALSSQSYAIKSSLTPRTLARIVTVSIAASDLNEIKRLGLCLTQATCGLSFPSTAVSDMRGNAIKEVPSSSGLLATPYTSDTSPPSLSQFAIMDLNANFLELSFSETVRVSTFQATDITVQDWCCSTGLEVKRRLVGGVLNSTDGTSVRVYLTKADADFIKTDARLCPDAQSCWVRFPDSLIRDMTQNKVTAVADGSTVILSEAPQSFVADSTSPALTSWTIDLNNGRVVLTFNEPVDPADLTGNAITLQNKISASSTSFTLTGRQSLVPATGNSLTVQFDLLAADLQDVRADLALCTSVSDCFISYTNAAMKDTSNNAVTPRSTSNGLGVARRDPDNRQPSPSAVHCIGHEHWRSSAQL